MTIADLIRQQARAAGYSSAIADALVAVSHAESGHDPRSLGDGGTSYGLFQLHRGGALGNMSDAQARRYLDPRENTRFVLNAIRPLVHNGMDTRTAIDAIVRRFERPANPGGEINRAIAYLGGAQPSAAFPSSSTNTSPGGAFGDAAGPDPAMQRAIAGAQANERLLNLPHIKMPSSGSIPFRATLDPGVQPPTPAGVGGAITAAAKHFLGVKYTWGGTTPEGGFDCSGLVQYVFNKFGITTPRVSQDQFRGGQAVNPNQARPGDLIFFRHAGGDVGHVGIYLGNGQFLHAPHTGDVVKISNLAGYGLPVAGYRRYAR